MGALVFALGCNRDRADRERPVERPTAGDESRSNPSAMGDKDYGTTTVTGAKVGAVSNQTGIERIVGARCARETTCNNVGVDKKYVNAQACNQKIRADMHDDLNAKDCPHGVDPKALDECLESIRKESCGNPIDTISRLAACRTGDICLKTSAPSR